MKKGEGSKHLLEPRVFTPHGSHTPPCHSPQLFYTPLPTPWRVVQDPGPRRRRHYQGSSGAKEFACERCQVDSRGCVSVTPVLDSPCPTWSVHLLSSCSHALPHISNLPNFLKYINSCWVTQLLGHSKCVHKRHQRHVWDGVMC